MILSFPLGQKPPSLTVFSYLAVSELELLRSAKIAEVSLATHVGGVVEIVVILGSQVEHPANRV